jgi:hypothetical protein
MPDPSSISKPKKKKSKEDLCVELASALFKRLSDKMMLMEERQNKRMMDMLERQQLERKRVRKADDDKWNTIIEKILGMVRTLVAKAGPKPL